MEKVLALRQEQISYELYQEIAEDLGMPIDPELSLDVRLELYQSKIIYLRNIFEQAFVEANSPSKSGRFSLEDLSRLKKSAEITAEFIRQDILQGVRQALDTAGARKGNSKSRKAG